MVEEHDFLFGTEPCVADFAAYHPLWFTRRVVPLMDSIFDATPAVLEWMDRIEALGQGASKIQRGRRDHRGGRGRTHAAAGRYFSGRARHCTGQARVQIAAESFGTEVTEGELLAATRTRYTLRRTDPRAGTVHVHFPRIGYVLKKAARLKHGAAAVPSQNIQQQTQGDKNMIDNFA